MGTSDIDLRARSSHVKSRAREVLTNLGPALGIGDWLYFVVLIVLCVIPLFIPVAVVLIVRRVIVRRRQRREILGEVPAFLDRAALTIAYPLMVNSSLLKPGTRSAPGLFLVSPDPATGNDGRFNIELIETISLPESPPLSEADAAWCTELFFDETFTPLRLRKVPATLTGGRIVYAADLAIDGRLLHGHSLSEDNPFLPCLFDETSRMCVVLPIWALGDASPTPGERTAFLEAILLQQHLRHRAG